jgi:AraC-like DNA-binding protein
LFNEKFCNYPFHWHTYLEILYLEKGKLDVSINGTAYALREGDIVIVNPDLIHGYFNVSQDTHTILFLTGFEMFDQLSGDLRDNTNETSIFGRKTIITPAHDPEIHKKVVPLIYALRDEYLNKKDGFRLAIKKILYEIALLFLREIPPEPRNAGKKGIAYSNFPALERTFTYLHEHYDDPGITLAGASRIALLSKFYFSRFFRERTGMTFHTYLSRLRVSRSQELLFETDMTITDIAYCCGFASLKTFNRLFRSYTGVCPSSFRLGAKGPLEAPKGKGKF